ncbi:hypothetical protein [Pseudosulfitobacter pseudonitzschiae]|uniref:hypothetical protein n=1 Tax=Pseudosulfitobacter pseudonitzschiae TaxID=1402135 RepID=UPI003B7C4D85
MAGQQDLAAQLAHVKGLLGEARAALPSDKRSYRGLKKKIDMALGLSSLTTKDPIPDVKSDTILPGSKVVSKEPGDQTWNGIVLGPSDYEGGVMVRVSKTLIYACSIKDLETVDPGPNEIEAGDFEAWLYQQSNVTRDCQDLYLLTRLWRLDFEWHDNPREHYRSKA